MRLTIFTLILAGGLVAAGMAAAQMMPMMSPTPPANATYGGGIDEQRFPSQQERYAARIAELRAKMLRLTAADGGQLTPEHRASLQKELDGVNHRFGIRPAPG